MTVDDIWYYDLSMLSIQIWVEIYISKVWGFREMCQALGAATRIVWETWADLGSSWIGKALERDTQLKIPALCQSLLQPKPSEGPTVDEVMYGDLWDLGCFVGHVLMFWFVDIVTFTIKKDMILINSSLWRFKSIGLLIESHNFTRTHKPISAVLLVKHCSSCSPSVCRFFLFLT